MNIRTIEKNGHIIAVVDSPGILVTDVQSALDLFVTIRYECGTSHIVLPKAAFTEDFYALKTRLAGEVLQKVINYRLKLAIHGDFAVYHSRALRDFIYECNNGQDIFFQPTVDAAIDKLGRVR